MKTRGGGIEEEAQMKTEAENGVKQLQAKKCQGCWHHQDQEEARKDSVLEPSEEHSPAPSILDR